MPPDSTPDAGYGALAALAVFLVGSLAVGAYAERRMREGSFLQSYFLGNRGLGAWALALTATVQSGGTFMGYPALVYSYGKSSPGSVRDVLTRQLDPYYLAPLWPDSVALAALQAQALIDTGATDEPALAAIGARSRADAVGNPHAQLRGSVPQGDYLVRPLRTGDCPPIGDGAAAVVLAAGERARELCERPAWIRGIDHRVEAHGIGVRDLTDSPSTRIAAERAGVFERPVDTAELHAPFSSQEVILRKVLGLDETVRVNPSGGAQAANPIMAAGLIRVGEAAARIHRGESDRALAHATSGPCLQQNLVAVLEGDPR